MRERVEQHVERERLVDQQQVEPVANAETIETRRDQRERLVLVGGLMHVQDAPAFRVRERAYAVLRRKACERRSRRPTAAENHEWDELRQRDECARAVVLSRADEPDRADRQPDASECRA
jgi:hypothetical protein